MWGNAGEKRLFLGLRRGGVAWDAEFLSSLPKSLAADAEALGEFRLIQN